MQRIILLRRRKMFQFQVSEADFDQHYFKDSMKFQTAEVIKRMKTRQKIIVHCVKDVSMERNKLREGFKN